MSKNPNDIDNIAEHLEEGQQEESDQRFRRAGGWAGWLISLSFHALLIALMTCIYFLVKPPEVDMPPVRIAMIESPPKHEEKPKVARTLETTVELDVQTESDHPNPISQLELPVENSEREEDNDNPVAKGREEAIADSEMGGSLALMAIGVGGGGSGMFGSRTPGGKKRAVGKLGGSKGSESAVDTALRWLKKHQSPNGMWDCEHYPENCVEAQRCEPGKHWLEDQCEVGLTGFAVLCYLGAGYDHQTPNKYKVTDKKGLDYLISIQNANGYIGRRNYENAVATMALAEAFAMTGDPALRGPAQNGVNAILACQNQDLAPGAAPKESGYGNGFGWDYVSATARNDSSVTGWQVMALKSALAGGLNVGNGMDGAKKWLERTWKATNPGWASLNPYTGESRMPYAFDSATGAIDIAGAPAPGAPSPEAHDLTCVGCVCAVFLGHHAGDPMLETLANYVSSHQIPKAYPCNTYYMYYNTLAMFQVGGEKWKTWNRSVRDMPVNAQRKDNGCLDGSWDWAGTWPGLCPAGTLECGGRVLSTVFCCLSLEVYYRYAKVAGGK
ncbi:MAG: terpene cyclase/mutase family protein [Planctomycetes bacterium]|nr:terpene cyclase/mutase family protein [Planctomycetota bacterium]